jgi:hypothetical protein
MPLSQWADDHGYEHVRCRDCGWSGYSDTGVPDCSCGDVESCDDCGEELKECTCERCAECGFKVVTECDDQCSCEPGPAVQTLSRSTVQVARKDYPLSGISKGDKYRRTVTGGYYKNNGPRWMTVSRKLVRRVSIVQ